MANSGKIGNLPAVENISPRVVRILGCNPSPFTFHGTNTYLVGMGKKRILIDTGESNQHDYIQHLKDTLANQNAEIQAILVTHWHRDHVGGAHDVIRHVLPPETAQTMKITKIQSKEGLDEFTPVPNGYEFVTDGHVLKCGNSTLRIVHTPGHTDDHMSIYLVEEQALFSGDCILGVSRPVFEDLGAYQKSLERLQNDFCIGKIYPGHGPVIENPSERIKDYLRNIERRERLIFGVLRKAKRLKQGVSVDTLVNQLYLDLSFALKLAAAVSVVNHLKKLESDRKVYQKDCLWFINA